MTLFFVTLCIFHFGGTGHLYKVFFVGAVFCFQLQILFQTIFSYLDL